MAENRTPRKKGQKRKSSEHSDLYTDEDPKGTIRGLGFKDAATARKGVSKINKADRKHSHKVQASLVMKQRAKVAKERAKDPEKKKDLSAAYSVWSSHLEKLKKKTKSMKEDLIRECVREVLASMLSEAVYCRVCGDPTHDDSDTCEDHKNEPTKLELLGSPEAQSVAPPQPRGARTVRKPWSAIRGGPKPPGPF